VFQHIPYIVRDISKLDLLYTMQIGILDHLKQWIFHFMQTNEQLDKYNAIWVSVPAYHDLTPKKKSYEEVCPWNGKEMKEISWDLLGRVTQSQRGGSPAQRAISNRIIECTQTLLEFNL